MILSLLWLLLIPTTVFILASLAVLLHRWAENVLDRWYCIPILSTGLITLLGMFIIVLITTLSLAVY